MTEPLDVPSGAVVPMPADPLPVAVIEVPQPPRIAGAGPEPLVFTVPVPGPPGKDGQDLSDEDLAELTADVAEDVQAAVDATLEPPVDLVLVFENALQQ